MTDPPLPPEHPTQPLAPAPAEAEGITLDALFAKLHYLESRLPAIERRLAWVETQVAVQARQEGDPP